MVDVDTTPQLPDLFPTDDVTVAAETHTFRVAETDSGVQRQLEYTLDKAPVAEIIRVQGQDADGTSRTFSNGVDYDLENLTRNETDTFTYDGSNEYLLTYDTDGQLASVTDEAGTTYTQGDDYSIESDTSEPGGVLKWLDDGSTPPMQSAFSVSYEVTFENSVLVWQTDANNLPAPNSEFYVDYRADSIIGRYVDAHADELEHVDEKLQEVISQKFVEQASGDSLDELGQLFGPIIGARSGRTDTQYRIYLKSIVQSFISRGTVNGIKLAISAATDVPLEDITINEDFENVEYEVVVIPNNPVELQLLEDVAEIADPSGVNQIRTRFRIDVEEAVVDDSIFITEGLQISDGGGSADSTSNFGFGTEGAVFDRLVGDDATTVNANKFLVAEDESNTDDAIAFSETKTHWDDGSWDSMNWTTEHN